MKPIEYRSDIAFLQALRCVQYRIPSMDRLKQPGFVLSLGLRYGLIGVSATFHLLETASSDDEKFVMNLAGSWPRIVEDHVRFELRNNIPFPTDQSFPLAVSRCAARPLGIAVPHLQRLCPIENCLEEATEQYISENLYGIRIRWPFYLRRRALREFRKVAQESKDFAVNFFDRRKHDLEEVPEIALLGE